MQPVLLTECPRDAMQSWPALIPTQVKLTYLRQLLRCGFSRIDALSFVNPKAIPQFADADTIAEQLGNEGCNTPLIGIVGNLKGAQRARPFPHIHYLGFPYSISPTFLEKNIQSEPQQALRRLLDIQEEADNHGKKTLVYLSMAFGNPYQDPWSPSILMDAIGQLVENGFQEINLSDTTGVATSEVLKSSFQDLATAFPQVHFGAHLHVRTSNTMQNLQAAWEGGCRIFDSAILGFGGCPVTADNLTGNLATETLMDFLQNQGLRLKIHKDEFNSAISLASHTFI